MFSNRQTKSLLDKMVDLVHSLAIPMPFYLVVDAYYASKGMVHGLLNSKNHLITHVRKNAVAYWPAVSSEKRRGPKRKYGQKVKLRTLFQDVSSFIEAPSPAYGVKPMSRYGIVPSIFFGVPWALWSALFWSSTPSMDRKFS